MAKCIGSISDWTPKISQPQTNDLNFLIEDTTKGEEYLRNKLEDVTTSILDIANYFLLIKQTIVSDGIKLNSTEVRDCLIASLRQLNLDTYQITNDICNSKLSSPTKHRYFILYSCGVIAKLQQLLQVVGRLSELDQRIYLEEQQNLFISDESIIIHSLTSIWTATITIMNNFREPSRAMFSEEGESEADEYNFVDQMEFSTSGYLYARIFVMDLLITSWIQFNRLVKFDDLVKGLPFLCPCHCKAFFTTIKSFGQEDQHKVLAELLPLIIDYQSKPSFMTESIRQCNIVPFEPCYSLCDQQSLAYFVVWNIYAISRIVKQADKVMITNCKDILDSSSSIAMKQFEAITEQPGYKLSPHQEERHKLLTHMKFSLEIT